MKLRVSSSQRRILSQASLALCLALISVAYVRLFNPGAFTDAYSPSKRPLPILSVLEERNIKSTFFLVGYWVDKYPERVQQIYEAGHEIGNHSTTHPHMSELSDSQIIQELNGVADKIEKLTGKRPDLFRPPYGDYDDSVVTVSRAQGYECVQWDCDSLDWKNLGVEPMIKQVTQNVKDGSIILFHNNSQYITQALPTILDTLLAEGYEIVPVSELILRQDYWIDHTGMQHANSESGESDG